MDASLNPRSADNNSTLIFVTSALHQVSRSTADTAQAKNTLMTEK